MSRVLLFDLGGVLIDNVTFEELPCLLPAPMERAALQDRWLHSPAVQRYERGEIDADQFATDFISEWSLSLSPAQFIETFAAWPRGFFPGAVELLADLRKRHTIAFLSNCNAIHWERLAHVLDHADLPTCGGNPGLRARGDHFLRRFRDQRARRYRGGDASVSYNGV